MKKLKSDKTSINFENTRKVLVPIYLLNVVYKGKDYTYIMNGQNGKSYINLPIGKFETILFIFS